MKLSPAPTFTLYAALLAALLCASATFAEWKNTTVPVPVERLLKNLDERLKENPADAHLYYLRGRIHSLAFATGGETLYVNQDPKDAKTGRESLPDFPCWETIRVRMPQKLEEAVAKRKEHLVASIEDYRKASTLDPRKAYYFLGLGWVLEHAAPAGMLIGETPGGSEPPLSEKDRAAFEALVEKMGSQSFEERESAQKALAEAGEKVMPVLFARKDHEDIEVRLRISRLVEGLWANRALEAYRKAFSLSVEADLKTEDLGPSEDYSVALEAGRGILRLLEDTEPNKAERANVAEAVKKIGEAPREITPVVVPLEDGLVLEDLLSPGLRVSFDLAGDGRQRQWPWVNAKAGLLVWDPLGSGRVESALQLFGSATWWMSFRNGYEPLACLDDDRDGWLAGAELAGLAVWRDSNCDGVSGAGEVLSLEAAGIEALAVKPDRTRAGALSCARGARLRNGRFRPTFDWMPKSEGR